MPHGGSGLQADYTQIGKMTVEELLYLRKRVNLLREEEAKNMKKK
jgi:hypothetical protein